MRVVDLIPGRWFSDRNPHSDPLLVRNVQKMGDGVNYEYSWPERNSGLGWRSGSDHVDTIWPYVLEEIVIVEDDLSLLDG